MSILGKIFTWWNGATFGTMLDSARNGVRVGEVAPGPVVTALIDDWPKAKLEDGCPHPQRTAEHALQGLKPHTHLC